MSKGIVFDHFRRTGGHRGREVLFLKNSIDLEELFHCPSLFSSDKCPFCSDRDGFEVIYEFSKPDQQWWVRSIKDPWLKFSLVPERIVKNYFDGTSYCEATMALLSSTHFLDTLSHRNRLIN